jgi:hypothetical protein
VTAGYEDFTQALTSVDGPILQQSNIPFWGDNPNAWDQARVAGVVLPGTVIIDAKVGARVDHKPIPGTHGGKTTFLNYEAAKVTMTVTVWTADQLEALADFITTVRPSTNIQPIDISHPSLAILSISSVKVIDISAPKRNPALDSYSVVFEMLENWVKPTRAAVTSSSASKENKFQENAVSPKITQDLEKPSRLNGGFRPAQ